ncbi:MAG: hypothetical protein QM589_13090 [Thermomicrobiales bacterium]
MIVTRRSLVQGAILAPALSAGSSASAQEDATPAGEEALSVDEVVWRLRTRPILSPLFPSDTGELAVLDWVDDGDEDLDGTAGAFLIQDTAKGDDDNALIGAYIVHPTVRSAEERMQQQATDGRDEHPMTLLGRSGASAQYPDGYSLVAVVDGFVIVSATGGTLATGPDAPDVTDFREADARALTHLAGLLDHLRTVMAKNE